MTKSAVMFRALRKGEGTQTGEYHTPFLSSCIWPRLEKRQVLWQLFLVILFSLHGGGGGGDTLML